MSAREEGAGIHALVPVKCFDSAKSRLAAVLGRNERAALATVMLRDVLDVLAGAEALAGVLVVTSEAEAAAIGRAAGADVVDDPAEAGTNEAVLRGIDRLAAKGSEGVLVVAGDIPFVTAEEIGATLAAMRRGAAVLVPANRDRGTNILGLTPPRAFTPAFGPESFARHLAAARAEGVSFETFVCQGAGHDIDVPEDLFPPEGGGPAHLTRAWLASRWGIAVSGAAESPAKGRRHESSSAA
jgi:2-phospho-L-lactate guanylyltransferase